jgi:hypothetical protein
MPRKKKTNFRARKKRNRELKKKDWDQKKLAREEQKVT